MRDFEWTQQEVIQPANMFNESIETDVAGVQSDAVYKKGFAEFPVFTVTEEEFMGNMEGHRQRCRFKSEKVAKYMAETRYKKPFYIRYENEATGKTYLRKIK